MVTPRMMGFLESLSQFHVNIVELEDLMLAQLYLRMMENIF